MSEHEFESSSDEGSKEPRASVTVQELDNLIAEIAKLREVTDTKKTELSQLNKELESMEFKAVAYLKELGRKSYKTDNGMITRVEKWRVNIPATPEAKNALFNYFKERDLFDKYATVNSNSLNSYFMEEWENAKQRGEGMDFNIPGVDAPKLTEIISFRRK